MGGDGFQQRLVAIDLSVDDDEGGAAARTCQRRHVSSNRASKIRQIHLETVRRREPDQITDLVGRLEALRQTQSRGLDIVRNSVAISVRGRDEIRAGAAERVVQCDSAVRCQPGLLLGERRRFEE